MVAAFETQSLQKSTVLSGVASKLAQSLAMA